MCRGYDSDLGAAKKVHGIVDTEYYTFVDALRGIAILMVVLVHTQLYCPALSTRVAALAGSGARGVQLFFIISAFTLFSTSLQRFPTERNPRRSFYLRRAFRILPLWWVAGFLYFLVGPLVGAGPAPQRPLLDLALHATFLFGFSPAYMNTLVPGGWSLFCEETFYLLLPLLYVRLGNILTAARLGLILLGISVAWYVFGLLAVKRVTGLTPDYVFMFPFSQWFIFVEGVLLFHLLKLPGARELAPPLAYLVDFAAVLLLWVVLASNAPVPVQLSASVAFFVLFYAMAQRRSALRRVLDTPILRAFGRCCYSIYLFHFWLLSMSGPYVRRALGRLGIGHMSPNVQFVCTFLFFAVVCLSFGMCSFQLVEKPLVALGRRLIRKLNAKHVASSMLSSER